ncbi:uncharacterized protein BCR38DRAFT_410467 [Pseudomassariella vexata]|uniref:Uncharacterized protein n=1 Tax=Pseudomassariella vexata TaxID=1141098 RepID=A0A1Y2DW93_9PEZI|nr:uncharacterized protein BCR38DRAFT_410467 [Pseudomassariella vexata]ORY63562.1 hypothetical protein BCR38DRAFT_410467 [Pseudomassariella vexata]
MDTTSLQASQMGRSRFSKALPAPPPGLDDGTAIDARQVPRRLPALSNMAFPPRKESVGASMSPKSLDSPLPSLPAPSPVSEAPTKSLPSIPRKAIASPPSQLTAAQVKLRRKSSISSLLSAYSRSSTESVQRSSQDSSVTKNSEPSLSPELDATNDTRKEFIQTSESYSGNLRDGELPHTTKDTGRGLLPPPLKDVSMPNTPRTGLPATPRTGLPVTPRSTRPAESHADANAPSSPVSLTNGSPQKHEIWRRRRTSSKSDRSLAVAALKLDGVSHGSTAQTTTTTAQPLAGPTSEQAQNNPTNPIITSSQPPPPPQKAAIGGLPGRNIKPATATGPDSEMKSFIKKVKSLHTLKKQSESVGEAPDDETPEMPPMVPKKSPSQENIPTVPPAPPPKEGPMPELSDHNSKKAAREPAGAEVVSPVTSPDLTPRASGNSGNSIQRRPVGAQLKSKPSNASLNSPQQSQPPSQTSSQTQPHPPRTTSRPGLPSGPRPTASNANARNLNSDPSYVQETKVGPTPMTSQNTKPGSSSSVRGPGEMRDAPPVQNGPPMQQYGRPMQNGDSNGTKEFSQLEVPGSLATNKRIRNLSVDNLNAPKPLSQVNETELSGGGPSPMKPLSEADQKKVSDAIQRFQDVPRTWKLEPSAEGVFPAAPLTVNHFKCLGDHQQWLSTQNRSYPVACACCHVQDMNPRSVCKACNVRVCRACADLLREHKDLKVVVGKVRPNA